MPQEHTVLTDTRTGRPAGDHGSGADAINYALDVVMDEECDCSGFLRAWREGDLDEWPEFYVWLKECESSRLDETENAE